MLCSRQSMQYIFVSLCFIFDRRRRCSNNTPIYNFVRFSSVNVVLCAPCPKLEFGTISFHDCPSRFAVYSDSSVESTWQCFCEEIFAAQKMDRVTFRKILDAQSRLEEILIEMKGYVDSVSVANSPPNRLKNRAQNQSDALENMRAKMRRQLLSLDHSLMEYCVHLMPDDDDDDDVPLAQLWDRCSSVGSVSEELHPCTGTRHKLKRIAPKPVSVSSGSSSIAERITRREKKKNVKLPSKINGRSSPRSTDERGKCIKRRRITRSETVFVEVVNSSTAPTETTELSDFSSSAEIKEEDNGNAGYVDLRVEKSSTVFHTTPQFLVAMQPRVVLRRIDSPSRKVEERYFSNTTPQPHPPMPSTSFAESSPVVWLADVSPSENEAVAPNSILISTEPCLLPQDDEQLHFLEQFNDRSF